MVNRRVLLVRHVSSETDLLRPERDWRLTDAGEAQANALAQQYSDESIGALYASSFRRAIDTLKPLAERLGCQITQIEDLREKRLSAEPMADFLPHVERSFADYEYALPGGESASQALQRFNAAMQVVVQDESEGALIVASHGNVIALFLSQFDTAFGFDGWRAMTNPHVFQLSWSPQDGWRWPE